VPVRRKPCGRLAVEAGPVLSLEDRQPERADRGQRSVRQRKSRAAGPRGELRHLSGNPGTASGGGGYAPPGFQRVTAS